MSMSRRDRIKLKTQIVEALGSNEWTWDRQSVLMHEFGVEPSDSGYGPSTAELIADLSDADLVEMYSVVLDIEVDEVEKVVAEATDDSNWKRGYVRLFISHSAVHKKFVGEIADELAVVGIHGFVAHDTMEVSRPWQKQIENALGTMQAFVALVHPEFNGSAWCHEEVGWALGRRVPHYVIRMGSDPAAFIGRNQWPSHAPQSTKEIAAVILTWVSSLPGLGASMFDGLVEALQSAGNYMDAGATAERIAAFGSLTDEQFDRIDQVWWSNDQLYSGVLPTRALEPLYRANGRAWPPPKPTPPIDPEPF
jgi:TIR domain